jgi:hypothetical protein
LPALLLGFAAAPGIPAQEVEAYGDGYVRGDFGRVTYYEGGVTIRRAHSEQGAPLVEEATVNSPIFPGDSVGCDWGQRAEVQLADGTLVWIDEASEATFLDLPTPSIAQANQSLLQVGRGAIRVQLVLDPGAEFRVDTPAASVYPLGDGEYRIEVEAGGFTEVSSRRGVTEVVGGDGSVLVRSGMRTEVEVGGLPRQPVPYNTFVADGFDRFVERRALAYQERDRYPGTTVPSGEVYAELPGEVQPYYEELSAYGAWGYDDTYGYVWYPGDVAPGWRPYYNGYWAYGPSGYFWVSNDPWGWAPYHYGRWNWLGGRWCWAPGRFFAGAWVGWSWGSLYIGWSPLNYWNYPCYVGSPYYGYYDHHAWTFVHHKHINHYHSRHAVSPHEIGDGLRDNIAVTRPPAVSPRELADSRTARQRAVHQARADRSARIRPVEERGVRPSRTMAQLEERMSGRTGAATRPTGARGSSRVTADAPRAASGARRVPARTTDSRDPAVDRTGASGSRGRSSATRPSRGSMPGYERRLTSVSTPVGDRGSTNAGSRGRPSARTLPRPDSNSTVAPRSSPSRNVNSRLRDLYDRMSTPRTTRDRPSGTDRASPSRSRRPTSISTPASPSGRRTVRPQSSSPPSSVRRAPSRSGSSRAAPSGSSGRSGRSSARPSGSSGRSSGGSRARPSGSSGRSSGGSRARPGGSSGRGSSGSAGRGRSGGSSRSGSGRGRTD